MAPGGTHLYFHRQIADFPRLRKISHHTEKKWQNQGLFVFLNYYLQSINELKWNVLTAFVTEFFNDPVASLFFLLYSFSSFAIIYSWTTSIFCFFLSYIFPGWLVLRTIIRSSNRLLGWIKIAIEKVIYNSYIHCYFHHQMTR